MPPQTPARGAKSEALPPLPILAIVLLYAAFGVLWILLSDLLIDWLFVDPALILLTGTLKGMLFIALTSLLLFVLLRRQNAGTDASAFFDSADNTMGLPWVLIALAILSLTAVGMVSALNQQEETEISRLQAIADLKASWIAHWLDETERELWLINTSVSLGEDYRRWRETGDAAIFTRLQTRLEDYRRELRYDRILLLDGRGQLLWESAGSPTGALDAALRAAAYRAAEHGRLDRLGPYRLANGEVMLDFIVPLKAVGDNTAIVVLRTDPRRHLFPDLAAWPVTSTSGESLLFRRQGDEVLYLSNLRHAADMAAKLRLPLTEKDVIAVRVTRGDAPLNQAVEGLDYRNVPVIGIVRAVPGTDWFLVAKLDKAEVYALATRNMAWIAVSGLLALLVTFSATRLFRQRQQLRVAEQMAATQADKLKALQLLDALADASTDAIFAKDREGRYSLFNRAAGRFAGKSPTDVIGHDDTSLFQPEQAALIMTNDRRAMQEGRVVTFQEELNTPAGPVVFLATKGPLRDAAGKVIGLFGISRDITDLLRVEKMAHLWAQVFEHAEFGLVLTDGTDNRFIDVNPAFARELGYRRDELIGQPLMMVYPPEMHREVASTLRELDETGHGVFEAMHQGKDGHRFPVLIDITVIRSPDGRLVHRVAYTLDISERKRSEVQLTAQLNELRRWYAVTQDREDRVLELKREINALLAKCGRPPRYRSVDTKNSGDGHGQSDLPCPDP